MSTGGPLRRPEKTDKQARKDDPVEVSRLNGNSVLGVVRGVHTVEGHRNVCVATTGADLVTVGSRVKVVDGVDATQARQNAERGDND